MSTDAARNTRRMKSTGISPLAIRFANTDNRLRLIMSILCWYPTRNDIPVAVSCFGIALSKGQKPTGNDQRYLKRSSYQVTLLTSQGWNFLMQPNHVLLSRQVGVGGGNTDNTITNKTSNNHDNNSDDRHKNRTT